MSAVSKLCVVPEEWLTDVLDAWDIADRPTIDPLPPDIEAALDVAEHWNKVLKCRYEPQLEQHATDMLLVARALLKSHGKLP